MTLNHFLCSASVCVVKVDGAPYLCKTDEIGEICVNSIATGTAYYGLLGITKNVFEVCILFLIFTLKSNPISVDGPKGKGGVEACETLLGPERFMCSIGLDGYGHQEGLIPGPQLGSRYDPCYS